MLLKSEHPAVVNGRTVHLKTITTPDPEAESMTLKPSTTNSKLGGFVKSLKGRLKQVVENLKTQGKNHRYGRFATKTSNIVTKAPKGAKDWKGLPVYSLTLEERSTCPSYCFHWKSCYGNSMGFAKRYDHADAKLLMDSIEQDLMYLSSIHPYGYIVRLHVLGEFFSVEYVEYWATMLERHPNLKVFGYSARLANDAIGNELRLVRQQYPDRFKIWWSNGGDEGYSANSFESEIGQRQYRNGEAILCPHEIRHDDGLPLVKNCLSCGICFALDEIGMHILFTEKSVDINDLRKVRRSYNA